MIEKQLQDFVKHTVYILQHPQASPRETVVLAGIAVVLLLAILSFFSLFFIGKPRPVEEKVFEPPGRLSLKTDLLILGAALFVVLAVTLGVAAQVSRQPTSCRSCHQMTADYKSWANSNHRAFECANCHQDPGAFGYVFFKIRQFDMVIARLSKSYPVPITADVSNASCLQCHRRDIEGSIVVSGLRVRHREITAAGYKCTQCHNTAGHGSHVVRPVRPSMDQCTACHDGKKVFSSCSGCHVVDIGRPIGAQSNNYSAVRLGTTSTCRGCHSVAKCNKCHGLELPHPADWTSGFTHAPAAAFERKALCKKCHSEYFCNLCHRFPGHGANWRQEHSAPGPYDQQGCLGCHTAAPNLCALCHPRYAGIKVKQPRGVTPAEPKLPEGSKTF